MALSFKKLGALLYIMGKEIVDFPGGSDGKASAYKEIWVRSQDPEKPLEKEMTPHSSTLAWKIHGRRSLVGCSPWGR